MDQKSADMGQLRLILNVADIDRSAEFYGRMGFVRNKTEHDGPNFASFNYEGFTLDLMYDIIPQDVLFHFVLENQNLVDEAAEGMKKRGLEPGPAGNAESGNKGKYIEDPDGIGTFISVP